MRMHNYLCPACKGKRFFRIKRDQNWPCPVCDLEGYLLLRSDTLIAPHFVQVIRQLAALRIREIRETVYA